MSNEKTQSPQYQQQAAVRAQIGEDDVLDSLYKPLGLPAVNAAASQMHAVKTRTPGEQMG